VVVGREDDPTQHVFGFAVSGDLVREGIDRHPPFAEVAGLIDCYFTTGLPEAEELTEGGALPRPGKVAVRRRGDL
jgi:hypothetical protein